MKHTRNNVEIIMGTKQRLQHLAGIPLTEAEDEKKEEKKECSGSKCPFCGTMIEHGKLVEHIKSHHADLIKYYKEMEKEDK